MKQVLEFWPLIVAIGSMLIWIVRLESKYLATKEKLNDYILHSNDNLNRHKEDLKENDSKVWNKIETIQTQSLEILTTVSRLEGKLETLMRETN